MVKQDALARILQVKDSMNDYFVEREDVINGLFTSLVAQQNMLLLGPPGTAKSLIIKTFSDSMESGDYFQYLLTKFSVPEEIFGPISLSGLKNDRYERITKGKLPEAKVVFLDEIWKANSSILNSLLTAINEKVFFNGDGATPIPLEMLVGASNEYPQDSSLDALFDRFMLKYWVDYISDDSAFSSILQLQAYNVAEKITQEDLQTLREKEIQWDDDVRSALLEIRQELRKLNFVFSDRKWVNAVSLVEAQAILNGREETSRKDLIVLSDCMWNEHKDRNKVAEVIGKMVDPFGAKTRELQDLVAEVMANVPQLPTKKIKSDERYDLVDKFANASQDLETLAAKAKKLEKDAGKNKEITKLIDIIETKLSEVEGQTVKVVRM